MWTISQNFDDGSVPWDPVAIFVPRSVLNELQHGRMTAKSQLLSTILLKLLFLLLPEACAL